MPAQTSSANAAFYVEGDTWPPLTAQLTDGSGTPVVLTGASVVINIAFQRWSYYYSPTDLIVTNGPCVVNPDQTNNPGYVSWTPVTGDLDTPGKFSYRFTVTFPGGGVQTFPGNETLPLIVKTKLPG